MGAKSQGNGICFLKDDGFRNQQAGNVLHYLIRACLLMRFYQVAVIKKYYGIKIMALTIVKEIISTK
jgi:hypothetical protein